MNNLADRGAGHPDFGLYAAQQVQRGRPREGQVPERGVVEVKHSGDQTVLGLPLKVIRLPAIGATTGWCW